MEKWELGPFFAMIPVSGNKKKHYILNEQTGFILLTNLVFTAQIMRLSF
jgi:hypothetical protein